MRLSVNRVFSGHGLIGSEYTKIPSTLSSKTTSHSQRRLHTRNQYPLLPSRLTFPSHTSLKGSSRIIFTRTSSSAPVKSAAVLPTGAQNVFIKDDQEDQDNNPGFFSSSRSTASSSTSSQSSSLASVPEGFQGYDIRWKEIKKPTLTGLVPIYMDLAKMRLGALVTLTTMAGYAMTPMGSSLPTLLSLTVGTALCITSANAYNQFVEPPYDAQMSRTRNRVLVRKAVSPLHAWTFATITGLGGVGILAAAVNPLTAVLGAANLVLYSSVYTPMKRMSIANTWVGSIVGAIPPMMGWAACTNSLGPEAWLLGAFLYAWQFPHFNSLAWNLRADYSKAGYRMMAVTDPKLNARVSLRYTLAMIPLITLAPYLDMTSWWFAVDGNAVTAVMLASAVNFWRKKDDKSARQLFFGSLIYLPIVLALMMFHKKAKNVNAASSPSETESSVFASTGTPVIGQHAEEDDDEYEYVDEDEEDDEHVSSPASVVRT
ncbi:Protoheme IX farnesyltransferase, mitochondrial [Entomortierella lignicola]|nr:Protoheme IX farnesyltransferase, mitochondrial [Entomortierella lignicola]